MIDEKIINGLREYLKDHFIPEQTSFCECLMAEEAIAFEKPARLKKLSNDFIRSSSAGKISLRSVTDKASLYVKKHRKPGGFAHTLDNKRKEKGLSPADLYKKANIDRRQYSRFMGPEDRHPSMNTVISFALALKLKRSEFDELLQSAGYALSNSSSRDVCIMYCIEIEFYNVVEVNALLFAIGIEPLTRE